FQKLWPFNNTAQNGAIHPAEPQQDHGVSTKVRPIHASFNRGIPLNMKVVIRGDIRTGKTSLFERLQGHPFPSERSYRTTDQIQVANIPWQYAHTKDTIKVEIWDVVDKSANKKEIKGPNNSTLKIDNNTTASSKFTPTSERDSAPHAAFALDASTIDVYRNTDGVILLYDISKPWTFDYAAKALSDIPTNIPVLLLSNFTDDNSPSPAISNERLETLIEEHNNIRYKHPCAPANLIRHLDSSMKSGLGLKEIHASFGIAFLNVLRETHRKQFDQKTLEIGDLIQDLDKQAQEAILRRSAQKEASVLAHSKVAPLPVAIQTTNLNTVPRPSSLTSPTRKTRNDHTNVDILSPTPVSVQTPAVLFDFNSRGLDEEFFQTVSLDSGEGSSSGPAVISSVHPIQPIIEEQEDMDEDINPMVTLDEDISDTSRYELVDPISHQTQSLAWTSSSVEKGNLSSLAIPEEDNMHSKDFDNNENNNAYDSDYSTSESTPTFNFNLRQDSDIESQTEFPVASAMYYKHEPSGFEQQVHLPSNDLGLSTGTRTLSTYEELEDDHSHNPWGNSGSLLGGVSSHIKDGRYSNENQSESMTDRGNVVSATSKAGTSDLLDLSNDEGKMDGHLEDLNPSLTIHTEHTMSNERENDENRPSPASAGTSTIITTISNSREGDRPEASEAEKKPKKKNKKKNKRGK
ncbi:Rab-like protein 6, partial [Linnemannia zychae]